MIYLRLFLHFGLIIVTLFTLLVLSTNVTAQDNISGIQLNNRMFSAAKDHLDNVSFKFTDLQTGFDIEYNPREVYRAASIVKLYIAYTLADQFTRGNISPEEKITLRTGDIQSGAGRIAGSSMGTEYTLSELIQFALLYSDNSAAWMIKRRLGTLVSRTIRDLGFMETHISYYDLAGSYPESLTTVEDAHKIVKLIYQRSLDKDGVYFRNIIYLMSKQVYREGIPSAFSEDTVVANKTGLLDLIFHDSALINRNNKYYLLTIFTRNLSLPIAQQIAGHFGQFVHQYTDEIEQNHNSVPEI